MPTKFERDYIAKHGRGALGKLRSELIQVCHQMNAYPDEMGFESNDKDRRGAGSFKTEDLVVVVYGSEELQSMRAELHSSPSST